LTRSRSSFVLAVSIALVVFVACGGGGKKKKTAATTTTSIGADFCTLSKEYVERTQTALAQDIADARANPTAFQGRVRDDFRAADKQIGQLAATAPQQIATDMKYLASVFDAFEKALEAVNFDPNKVEPQAYQRLTDVPYQEASKRVNDYAESSCGILATTTTILETTTSLRATTTSRRSTTTTSRPSTTTSAPTTTTTSSSTTTTTPPTTTTAGPPTTTTTRRTTTTNPCNGPFPPDTCP
jgi:hypothetical protein